MLPRTLLIAFLLSFFSDHAFGQDTSRANLFPLHDGDYWEYNSYLPFSFPDTFFTATLKVIGDTILSNGKTYKQIRLTDLNSDGKIFRRIDDSLNVLWGFTIGDTVIGRLLFKLEAQIGETWLPNFPDSGFISQVVDIYDVDAFGQIRTVMEIHGESYPHAIIFEDYSLMEGIGMTFWAGEGFYWSFRGAIVNGKQYGTITSVEKGNDVAPSAFELFQNYPNPFNAATTIRYKLTQRNKIQIAIYDIAGREVVNLVNEVDYPAGEYSAIWNGRDKKGREVASGIYFYQLRAGSFVDTKKALLVR
jgi:hypothetical protein